MEHDDKAAVENAANEPQPEGSGAQTLADRVRLALRKVKDPELNLNIVDLGLVYDIVVEGGNVQIDMSLTSPGCPAGPQIMGDVERAVKALPGVEHVGLNLVWNPMWTPDRIEPRVRAYMGL
ncbi:MAG TPA: metal-sulfur cluster assembly factor [Gemmatimonadaceae bacterium]